MLRFLSRNPVYCTQTEPTEPDQADAKRDPHSPYVGKFVGIANGQVVAVADSWREISRRLRQFEPDPSKCCCIEASADYDAVHEVWSVP